PRKRGPSSLAEFSAPRSPLPRGRTEIGSMAVLSSSRPRPVALLFERLQHLGRRSRRSWRRRLGVPLLGDQAPPLGRGPPRPAIGLRRGEAGRRFGGLGWTAG